MLAFDVWEIVHANSHFPSEEPTWIYLFHRYGIPISKKAREREKERKKNSIPSIDLHNDAIGNETSSGLRVDPCLLDNPSGPSGIEKETDATVATITRSLNAGRAGVHVTVDT